MGTQSLYSCAYPAFVPLLPLTARLAAELIFTGLHTIRLIAALQAIRGSIGFVKWMSIRDSC